MLDGLDKYVDDPTLPKQQTRKKTNYCTLPLEKVLVLTVVTNLITISFELIDSRNSDTIENFSFCRFYFLSLTQKSNC